MRILFVFNSILAAVALFNMYSVAEQVRMTAEIRIRVLDLYTFVSSIEFIMLLFIMPALTASSISGRAGTPDTGTDADDHDGASVTWCLENWRPRW